MEDQTGREKNSCSKVCGNVEVPSQEELRALNAMRAIKERVRDVKSRLSEISTGAGGEKPEERVSLEEELKRLKSEWETWERERKKAARERMILLGHEEPSGGL